MTNADDARIERSGARATHDRTHNEDSPNPRCEWCRACGECGGHGSLVQSDRPGLLACAGCGTYHEPL